MQTLLFLPHLFFPYIGIEAQRVSNFQGSQSVRVTLNLFSLMPPGDCPSPMGYRVIPIPCSKQELVLYQG